MNRIERDPKLNNRCCFLRCHCPRRRCCLRHCSYGRLYTCYYYYCCWAAVSALGGGDGGGGCGGGGAAAAAVAVATMLLLPLVLLATTLTIGSSDTLIRLGRCCFYRRQKLPRLVQFLLMLLILPSIFPPPPLLSLQQQLPFCLLAASTNSTGTRGAAGRDPSEACRDLQDPGEQGTNHFSVFIAQNLRSATQTHALSHACNPPLPRCEWSDARKTE